MFNNADSPEHDGHMTSSSGPLRATSVEPRDSAPSSPMPPTPPAPDLGPLPPNWEMAYTEDGTPYFIE